MVAQCPLFTPIADMNACAGNASFEDLGVHLPVDGAGGGTRTLTPSGPGILSAVRLPFRHARCIFDLGRRALGT
jgi:hypothetical protein